MSPPFPCKHYKLSAGYTHEPARYFLNNKKTSCKFSVENVNLKNMWKQEEKNEKHLTQSVGLHGHRFSINKNVHRET